jgi:hypothetical protein
VVAPVHERNEAFNPRRITRHAESSDDEDHTVEAESQARSAELGDYLARFRIQL